MVNLTFWRRYLCLLRDLRKPNIKLTISQTHHFTYFAVSLTKY